jgi:hypothetical protein
MGYLFVEASAKMAVGVTEASSEIVKRIIDTHFAVGRREAQGILIQGQSGGGHRRTAYI